jgi:hypothetical protein
MSEEPSLGRTSTKLFDQPSEGEERTEKNREQCYQLRLKGLSYRAIAKQMNTSLSTVQSWLEWWRHENAQWFDSIKNPSERLRSLFKATLDQYEMVLAKEWTYLEEAEKNEEKITVRNIILLGIRDTINRISEHLDLVLPSLDDLYMRERIKQLELLLVEKEQAAKIRPIAKRGRSEEKREEQEESPVVA